MVERPCAKRADETRNDSAADNLDMPLSGIRALVLVAAVAACASPSASPHTVKPAPIPAATRGRPAVVDTAQATEIARLRGELAAARAERDRAQAALQSALIEQAALRARLQRAGVRPVARAARASGAQTFTSLSTGAEPPGWR
jgi:hypothetical protein